MVYIAKFDNYKPEGTQLKSENAPTFYGDDDYNIIPLKDFPYLTLQAGASRLRIRKQRLSRMLRILQIPVHKIGTLILLDDMALDRVKVAVRNREVKRGRKPHAS